LRCEIAADRARQRANRRRAQTYHAVGEQDDAMRHLKRAVAIFSEVGGDDATRLPEIWKLVSW